WQLGLQNFLIIQKNSPPADSCRGAGLAYFFTCCRIRAAYITTFRTVTYLYNSAVGTLTMIYQVEGAFFFCVCNDAEADRLFDQQGKHVGNDEGVGNHSQGRKDLSCQQRSARFSATEATKQANPNTADEACHQVDAKNVQGVV